MALYCLCNMFLVHCIFHVRISLSLVRNSEELHKRRPKTSKIDINIYSKCQKYNSCPIFVRKLEIRLYPEFLSGQAYTVGCVHCVSQNINTIRLYKGVLHRLENAMRKMVYKHFSGLCKLYLKRMRKPRQFSAHGIPSSMS